jgi:hypothetical protein
MIVKRLKRRPLFMSLAATALIVCVAVGVMAAATEKAQPTETDPAACLEVCIQFLRTDIQAGKAALVAENLVLTEGEAQAFWPEYRKYNAAMASINDALVAALKEYGAAEGMLSNEKASDLLGRWFDIQERKLRLRRDYAKSFGKILPAAKVARFFQIDNRIDLMLQVQLASALPMLEPAEAN